MEMLLLGTAVVVLVGKRSLMRGAGVFGLGVSMMRASVGVNWEFTVGVDLNGVGVGVVDWNGLRVPGGNVVLSVDGAKVVGDAPGAEVVGDAPGARVVGKAPGAEVTGVSGGGVVVALSGVLGGGVVVSV